MLYKTLLHNDFTLLSNLARQMIRHGFTGGMEFITPYPIKMKISSAEIMKNANISKNYRSKIKNNTQFLLLLLRSTPTKRWNGVI